MSDNYNFFKENDAYYGVTKRWESGKDNVQNIPKPQFNVLNAELSSLQRDYDRLVKRTADDRIAKLQESVDQLTRKFDLIFGDHIMLNGRLIPLNVLKISGGENV